MHVAHGGGFGVWLILVDLFGREGWKGVEEAGIDGVGPGGDDGREQGSVIKGDAIA